MKLTTLAVAMIVSVFAAVTTAACSTPAAAIDGSDDSSADATEGSKKTTTTTTTESGLPCDVDKVLKTNCQTCHAAKPQYGASTSLVTWDDLQKTAPAAYPGKKVWEVVQSRIHDAARPMPAKPASPLAGADLTAMDNWFSGGAKKATASCTSDAPADAVQPLNCTPDTVLKSATPFVMPADAGLDTYQCVGIDINLAKKKHITAFAPNVDNKRIVHHMILFQTADAESTTPFACSAFGSANWKFVAGWAPGGNNLELPPEAGFPMEAGTTHWVMQVHYNNASNATGQSDNSGYSLCTTETLRPNDAGVMAFGSTSFTIPPRSTSTVKCDYKLDDRFEGKHVFNMSPHMHGMGQALSTARLSNGVGDEQMLFQQPNFSFEAQGNYPQDTVLHQNDVMRTRCTWKNPTDQAVSWGENSGDEMCFNFTGYYPVIPDHMVLGVAVFNWESPAGFFADCAMQ